MRQRVHDERPPVKFRLPRGRDAVPAIQSQGYASHPVVQHEDTWFERPQGAILGSIVLRHVLPEGSWTMAWETTIATGPEAERHHRPRSAFIGHVRQVIRAELSRGTLSEATVAAHLGLPELELQRRLTALFQRMGAASRNDAVTAAWRRGLIPAAPAHGA